jgi:hypothetical protein
MTKSKLSSLSRSDVVANSDVNANRLLVDVTFHKITPLRREQGCVVIMPRAWPSGVRIPPAVRQFSIAPIGPPIQWVAGLYHWSYSGLCVIMVTDLHLLPRSRMCGAILHSIHPWCLHGQPYLLH